MYGDDDLRRHLVALVCDYFAHRILWRAMVYNKHTHTHTLPIGYPGYPADIMPVIRRVE